MKIKFLAIVLSAAFATACVTKDDPSEVGELLTSEQIASLSAPDAQTPGTANSYPCRDTPVTTVA